MELVPVHTIVPRDNMPPPHTAPRLHTSSASASSKKASPIESFGPSRSIVTSDSSRPLFSPTQGSGWRAEEDPVRVIFQVSSSPVEVQETIKQSSGPAVRGTRTVSPDPIRLSGTPVRHEGTSQSRGSVVGTEGSRRSSRVEDKLVKKEAEKEERRRLRRERKEREAREEAAGKGHASLSGERSGREDSRSKTTSTASTNRTKEASLELTRKDKGKEKEDVEVVVMPRGDKRKDRQAARKGKTRQAIVEPTPSDLTRDKDETSISSVHAGPSKRISNQVKSMINEVSPGAELSPRPGGKRSKRMIIDLDEDDDEETEEVLTMEEHSATASAKAKHSNGIPSPEQTRSQVERSPTLDREEGQRAAVAGSSSAITSPQRLPLRTVGIRQNLGEPVSRASPGPQKDGRPLKPGGIQWKTSKSASSSSPPRVSSAHPQMVFKADT